MHMFITSSNLNNFKQYQPRKWFRRTEMDFWYVKNSGKGSGRKLSSYNKYIDKYEYSLVMNCNTRSPLWHLLQMKLENIV